MIQDAVESTLIKLGHDQIAKAYILYRQKRNEQREDKNVSIKVVESMNEYLDQSDWRVKANSNI
jgi:ribonucleoside-triphosphate reductase